MRLTKQNIKEQAEASLFKYGFSKQITIDGECNFNESLDALRNIANKLGQLEDIEDELGIDLITLFKAFNGIYYKKDDEIKFACHLLLTDDWSFIVLDNWITYQKTNFYPSFELNEYGKTWALTKEELEK